MGSSTRRCAAAVDAGARGGNVSFGGALSAAAGPVGRTAGAG